MIHFGEEQFQTLELFATMASSDAGTVAAFDICQSSPAPCIQIWVKLFVQKSREGTGINKKKHILYLYILHYICIWTDFRKKYFIHEDFFTLELYTFIL